MNLYEHTWLWAEYAQRQLRVLIHVVLLNFRYASMEGWTADQVTAGGVATTVAEVAGYIVGEASDITP